MQLDIFTGFLSFFFASLYSQRPKVNANEYARCVPLIIAPLQRAVTEEACDFFVVRSNGAHYSFPRA